MSASLGQVCRRFLHWLRPAPGRRRRRTIRPSRPPQLEGLEARTLLTGTWSVLSNTHSALGTMLLLTDGTVMAQGAGQSNTWFRLTPSASGSYTAGTWSARASMAQTRLYFGSNVLPDGRLFLVGGEYSSAGGFTNTGEIYNPVTNTWSNIANFPQSSFGDDPTMLLPDGRVLAGYVSGPQTYIYNPATNTWSFAANKLRNDRSDEETWVKLPDDSVLSYDVFNNGHAQRYVPSTNTWVDAGTVPVALSSSAVGSELGPAHLLPDGRVFYLGANGNTAFYNPSTNTWTAGPTIPNGLGCDDAPGAVLPNGKVLFAADRPLFHGPTTIFEFDPATNTYTDVTPPSSIISLTGACYTDRMLVLPTGQVLFTNSSATRLALYTPDGTPVAAGKPAVASIDDNGDGSFTLYGTLLNGISAGAAYGDDAEMDSNYPIVRFTNDATGAVTFARTFSWSSTGVATGSTPASTRFTLPSGLAAGHYSVVAIANGIASDPFGMVLNQPHDTGFETPNVGTGTYGAFQYSPSGSPWTFANGAGVAGNGSGFTDGNPSAPQGTQVAFIQGYGTASQAVTLAAGTYSVSFLAAQRGNGNYSSQTVQVQVDGTAVGTFTPAGTSYAGYSTVAFPVTAGSHTITFVGLDLDGLDNTAFLDHVWINRVVLVNGGDFETPIVGTGTYGAFQYDPSGSPWTFSGSSGISGNGSGFTDGNPNAPQGTQVAFLQALGSFSQSLSFTAGTYSLSFSAAQRGNGNYSSQTFQVLVDGTVVGTFTPADTNYAGYTTSKFTVGAGPHTVTFVGLDPDGADKDNTAFIDQVGFVS